jgi:hypothetical protein
MPDRTTPVERVKHAKWLTPFVRANRLHLMIIAAKNLTYKREPASGLLSKCAKLNWACEFLEAQ